MRGHGRCSRRCGSGRRGMSGRGRSIRRLSMRGFGRCRRRRGAWRSGRGAGA
jgi:hypothetical protein